MPASLLARARHARGDPRPPQEPALHAEVDARKVGVEDQVQLTLTLEGDAARRGAAAAAREPARRRRPVRLDADVVRQRRDVAAAQSALYVLQPTARRARRGRRGPRAARRAATRRPRPSRSRSCAGCAARPQRRPTAAATRFGDRTRSSSSSGRRRASAGRAEDVRRGEAQPHARARRRAAAAHLLPLHADSITDLQFADAPQYPGFWSEELERRAGAAARASRPPSTASATAASRCCGSCSSRRARARSRSPRSHDPRWACRAARLLRHRAHRGVERATKPVIDQRRADPRRARLLRRGGTLPGHRARSTSERSRSARRPRCASRSRAAAT